MPRFLLTRVTHCLLALLMLACGLPAQAGTSIWEVSKGGQRLLLGGTIHVLRDQDYPLPEAYQRAFDQAELVIFETDLRDTQGPQFQQTLLSTVRYPADESLADYLTPEAMEALTSHCAERGIPVSVLLPFKPAWTMLTLLGLELQRLGITSTGVDHFYTERALRENKAIAGLESAQQQLEFITSLGIGNESELVLHTLQELRQTETLLAQMVQMWREGDLEAMNRVFVEPMASDYPEIYQTVLAERNTAWLPQLERHLQGEKTALALVGVAHLVGEDGLLKQLRQRGYRVKRY